MEGAGRMIEFLSIIGEIDKTAQATVPGRFVVTYLRCHHGASVPVMGRSHRRWLLRRVEELRDARRERLRARALRNGSLVARAQSATCGTRVPRRTFG
jgi:hypothetical protein